MKPCIIFLLNITLLLSSSITTLAQTNVMTLVEGEWVYGAEFSNNGNKVVVGTLTNVELHDAETGQLIRKMAQQPVLPEGMQFSFGAFSFSADGKKLLGGHLSGLVVLWGLESGEVIHHFVPPQSGPPGTPSWSTAAVAFSADGKEIATLRGGALTFWDVETGLKLRDGKGTYIPSWDNAFGEMYLFPDRARVFVMLLGKSLITNYLTGERVADYGYSNATLSKDGEKVFLFDSTNQTYQILDVESKAVLRTISPNVIGDRLTVAPDNQTVAFSRDNIIYIERWPLVGDWKELAQIPINVNIEYDYPYLRFSPNGKQLMVRQSKSLKLYDVSDLTSGVSEAETPKQ